MSAMTSTTLALSLLLAPAALAQAPPAPPPAPTNAPPEPALPPQVLDAMRHHQPTQAGVDQLEIERYGQAEEQRQNRDQSDVEKLYDQLMREPTPKTGR